MANYKIFKSSREFAMISWRASPKLLRFSRGMMGHEKLLYVLLPSTITLWYHENLQFPFPPRSHSVKRFDRTFELSKTVKQDDAQMSSCEFSVFEILLTTLELDEPNRGFHWGLKFYWEDCRRSLLSQEFKKYRFQILMETYVFKSETSTNFLKCCNPKRNSLVQSSKSCYLHIQFS